MFTKENIILIDWVFCWACGIGGIIIVVGTLVALWHTRTDRPWWLTLTMYAMILVGLIHMWWFLPFSPGFTVQIDQ